MQADLLKKLKIDKANPAWGLLMQSGAEIKCQIGISLDKFLNKELGLSQEQLAPIDVFILNGVPVDELDKSFVPDGARLALAAALPGIAGLAMKKGSAVRGLRAGISTKQTQISPRPGSIQLSLYSIALAQLAGHFLEKGIIVKSTQIIRYAKFAPQDICDLDGQKLKISELVEILTKNPQEDSYLLKARLCPS